MKSYNMVSISPPKIEEIMEVITHAEFHPTDSSKFIFSSSKGYFSIGDLRINTSSNDFLTKYSTIDEESSKNEYSEIITSCSWASFCQNNDGF